MGFRRGRELSIQYHKLQNAFSRLHLQSYICLIICEISLTMFITPLGAQEGLSRIDPRRGIGSLDIGPFTEQWERFGGKLGIRKVGVLQILRIHDTGRKVGPGRHCIFQRRFVHARVFQGGTAQIGTCKVGSNETGNAQNIK